MRIESDLMKTGAALVVVGCVCAAAVWFPTRVRLTELARRMDHAKATINLAADAPQRVEVYQQVVDGHKARLANSQTHIPQTPEIAELMRQLNGTLDSRSVKDLRLHHRNEFVGVDYAIVPVEISFRGGFLDAFIFLEHVESMRRFVRVEQLNIAGEEHPELLDVSFKLSAFYMPDEEGETDDAAPSTTGRSAAVPAGGPRP